MSDKPDKCPVLVLGLVNSSSLRIGVVDCFWDLGQVSGSNLCSA